MIQNVSAAFTPPSPINCEGSRFHQRVARLRQTSQLARASFPSSSVPAADPSPDKAAIPRIVRLSLLHRMANHPKLIRIHGHHPAHVRFHCVVKQSRVPVTSTAIWSAGLAFAPPLGGVGATSLVPVLALHYNWLTALLSGSATAVVAALAWFGVKQC